MAEVAKFSSFEYCSGLPSIRNFPSNIMIQKLSKKPRNKILFTFNLISKVNINTLYIQRQCGMSALGRERELFVPYVVI